MSKVKMHRDEFELDTPIVRRLLKEQLPQYADLPVSRLNTSGTDNAIFRLGDELLVRMPRIDWVVNQVEKEHRWLPMISPDLPLRVPEPAWLGRPNDEYPWPWSVYRWLDGEEACSSTLENLNQAAEDIATFVLALHKVDTTDAPLACDFGLRGVPLLSRDQATRDALEQLKNDFDIDTLIAVWDEALQVQRWSSDPVWFHGDMLCGNLLVNHQRLSAVIDFGGLGVGDPACDLMIAWDLFKGDSRRAFRQALALDDATWTRGRAHALSQAAIYIPYYRNTNPRGTQNAMRVLNSVLEDAYGR